MPKQERARTIRRRRPAHSKESWTCEPFDDRNRIDAASVAASNERAAALITAAALDGADFTGDDVVGLFAVLEEAVVVVERYELMAG